MPTDPADIAAVVLVLALALAWHEAAHAWVADRLGDPTARSLGRVTLNPLKHLDLKLSLLLPVAVYVLSGGRFAFGGGKPVPVRPGNFPPHKRVRNFMLVALAGPGSNLLLAGLWGLGFAVSAWFGWIDAGPPIVNPYRAASSVVPVPSLDAIPESWLADLFVLGVLLNLLLALFNLIPIPPLDGSRFVGWLLPRKLQPGWYRLDRVGFVVLLALVLFLGSETLVGGLYVVLDPLFGAYDWAVDQLIALDPLGTFA